MTLKQFTQVTELSTKLISISSFFIGTLYAVYQAGSFYPHLFFLMLTAVLAVDLGTTGFNTYFDYRRGVDSRHFTREPNKLLIKNSVSPDAVLIVSSILYLLAGLFGIAIAVFRGFEVIAAGSVSLLVGFFYNGGPHPLSRTPFGEFYAGGFLGSVLLILSYYVQTGEISLYVFLLSLPSFFLIASILTSNNTCDKKGDLAAGRKTLTIVIGEKKSEFLIYFLGSLSFLLFFLYAGLGLVPVYGILPGSAALFYAVLEYRKMHRKGYSHETKALIMFSILRVTLAYSISVIATLVIGIITRS